MKSIFLYYLSNAKLIHLRICFHEFKVLNLRLGLTGSVEQGFGLFCARVFLSNNSFSMSFVVRIGLK